MEKKALYAIVKTLMDAYISEKMKNDALTSTNLSLTKEIADLNKEKADDFALDGEMGKSIQDLLSGDTGGSMGGVTKAVPIA